jgi:CRISPR-associated protein Cas2
MTWIDFFDRVVIVSSVRAYLLRQNGMGHSFPHSRAAVAAFLIAYDIAHPRRLRRVARVLERRGIRCQYSVFVFRGTDAELRSLLDELAALIRPAEDVVQAWPVPSGVQPEVYARGSVRPVCPAGVVIAGGRPLFVSFPVPDPESPTSPEKT